MKLKIVLAAAAALLAPAFMTANAQAANVYLGGGYTHFDGEGGGELGGITGRLGVGFGQHFAVEGEATFGVNDDDGLELDNEFGIFGLAKLPLSSQFDIFGRVGWARTETSPGGDADGLAYGVGGQFNLTPKDGIRGDWTRHDYDENGEIDTYAISYIRSF
jgi:outer membrane immunogenic protein